MLQQLCICKHEQVLAWCRTWSISPWVVDVRSQNSVRRLREGCVLQCGFLLTLPELCCSVGFEFYWDSAAFYCQMKGGRGGGAVGGVGRGVQALGKKHRTAEWSRGVLSKNGVRYSPCFAIEPSFQDSQQFWGCGTGWDLGSGDICPCFRMWAGVTSGDLHTLAEGHV